MITREPIALWFFEAEAKIGEVEVGGEQATSDPPVEGEAGEVKE